MSIRASAAACEITPESPVSMIGYQQTMRTSTGIKDPLYASAVHLRGGSGGIVVVSLDVLALDPLFTHIIRTRISAAIGLKEENIFISTTQNHSGPPTSQALYLHSDPKVTAPDADYMELIVKQSVRAASEAAVASCPCSVATVFLDKPGTCAIIIKANNGRILGLIVVYDEIPNHLGPDNTELSSDFLAALRNKLTARFGGSPVVSYLVAPSADKLLEDQNTYGADVTTRIGETLASLIVSKVKSLTAKDFFSNIIMQGKLSDAPELPRRDLPGIIEVSAMMTAAFDLTFDLQAGKVDPARRKTAVRAAMDANRTMNLTIAQQKGRLQGVMDEYKQLRLHLLQVDKMKILGLPCKIQSTCGQHLTAKAGDNVLLAECIDGDLQGSIIARDEGTQGSYRLMSPLFDRGAGEQLANAALTACADA